MKIQTRLSPSYNARPTLEPVDVLVLHYTGMPTGDAALARLCDPAAEVSAHYFVEEDGSVLQLVEEEYRAWHAGISHWRGRDGLNDTSIGIEIVNPGHEFGYRPFPEAQMQAVAELCRDILRRHDIPARNVVAHSDIAPTRKADPGELFPWAWLAAQGVGIWPHAPAGPAEKGGAHGQEKIFSLQTSLGTYGYGIDATGEMDVQTTAVITAFQRHFRPECVDGVWDAECDARLQSLLAQAGGNSYS